MGQITVTINTSGLTTAEQFLTQLAAQRADLVIARAHAVDAHKLNLAQIDSDLSLFDERIAELRAFVDFKTKAGAGG